MTKYRIKIITYKSGRKEYIAQKKIGFWWEYLFWDGNNTFFKLSGDNTREEALDKIDRNFDRNNKEQSIEFEYITLNK